LGNKPKVPLAVGHATCLPHESFAMVLIRSANVSSRSLILRVTPRRSRAACASSMISALSACVFVMVSYRLVFIASPSLARRYGSFSQQASLIPHVDTLSIILTACRFFKGRFPNVAVFAYRRGPVLRVTNRTLMISHAR
jgi:hypothetical protein